ncbi:hypothetical protein CCHR01_05831 [Colletotrichum chrysophilum]|uniref:Uncharacterized protein n=1 Tax=Colletotrichum chrysophilum TaxID=1836956 RepID=A0AAD9ART5_9PEZI|nr:hypothetical protein CCHR01_05831 [Colletotrichum chrysophilum]
MSNAATSGRPLGASFPTSRGLKRPIDARAPPPAVAAAAASYLRKLLPLFPTFVILLYNVKTSCSRPSPVSQDKRFQDTAHYNGRLCKLSHLKQTPSEISSKMPSEGRQSPPPERQTGAQLNDPPASGKGTDDATNKEQVNKEQLENLSSNPKGPLDDAVKEKFAKTE